MVYVIIKKTRGEQREALRVNTPERYRGSVRGGVRTTEEAYEVQRQLEREGEAFDKPLLVSGDSPEAKQAAHEVNIRAGIDPETGQRLHG